MDSAVQSIWLVGASTLIIGIVLGLLIARSSNNARSKEALIEELNDARREFENYKVDVSSHFSQTADLVNNLTDSYREVHQHLSNSASRLCSEDEQLLVSLERPAETAANSEVNDAEADQTIEPPRDYAPKNDPESSGTLAEDFGLKQKEALHDPSLTVDHAPSRS
ncbi:MAG: DUF1043 family protein [Halopseudomonas sp.]